VFGIQILCRHKTADSVVYGQFQLEYLLLHLKYGAAEVAAEWLVAVNKAVVPAQADMPLRLVQWLQANNLEFVLLAQHVVTVEILQATSVAVVLYVHYQAALLVLGKQKCAAAIV
jgi:hypothetical protein